LSLRLPRSDSRQAFRPPEDTSTGGGAVEGGEVVPAGEPEHLAHVADHGAGDDRADAEQTGQAGAGDPDRCGQLLVGVAQLGIEAADVVDELGGQLAARLDDRIRWPHLLEDAGGLAGADLLADPAGHQVGQHRVQPARGLVTGPGQVAVPLGPHLQHGGVVLGDHRALGRGPQRRDRHREGVIRVVLVDVPGLQ
jgi:hypothetical protein